METANGFSIVELLIVLTIIGLLGAIVGPAVVFYMKQPGQDLGARSLFTVMRGARVYAAAHNVPTAVVFNVRQVQDSATGEMRLVLSEYLVARELKRGELESAASALAANGVLLPRQGTKLGPLYVPVGGYNGAFTEIEGDACVLGEAFNVQARDVFKTDRFGNLVYQNDPNTGEILYDAPFLDRIEDLLSTSGMSRIRLLNGSSDFAIVEASATPVYIGPLRQAFAGHMPAYVFRPDGSMRVHPEYGKQSVILNVSALPSEPVRERFLIDPATGEIETGADGLPIERVTHIGIQHTTGRVRIL